MREALSGDSRLISFQPTSEEGFIIEIGNESVRVYDKGVLDETIASPWLSSEVFELQWEQLNDVMFITHKNHPPQQLNRITGGWSFGPVVFDYPPFLDYVLDGTEVEVTAGGSTDIESETTLSAEDSENNAYSGVVPSGDWEVVTTTNSGSSLVQDKLSLEKSLDGGNTWEEIQTIEGTGAETGSEGGGLLRLHSEEANIEATLTTTNSSANLAVGGAVTITSTDDIFETSHIGSEFEVTHPLEKSEMRLALNSSGTSEGITVQGDYLLTTSGLWKGKVTIENSLDSGATWNSVVVREAFGDRNISYEGFQNQKALMRILFSRSGAGANNPHATLEAIESQVSGRVKITGFTSSTVVTGSVVDGIYSEESTELWKHAAWSGRQGYPAAVCWHDQRVWYGGSWFQPSTLWASVIEDFFNFRATTLDDASFSRRIAANEQSDIRWLASKQYLFIGTGGAEWRGSSDSDSGVITPSSFRVSKFSSFGSASLPAVITGSNMLYIQRQGRKVREISYTLDSDGYSAADLTLLSIHSTMTGIKDVAYQAQRDSVLWATTNCGRLVGLTYDKSQNVYAWHTHTTKGEYESVATVYEQGDEDSIYCIVKRDGVRMLERFQPEQYEVIEESVLQDMLFMDSAVIYDGDATTTLSGFDHLEGETVQVLADGSYVGDKVVASGEITLDVAASKIKAGLEFLSLIETMPMNYQGTDGKFKKVSAVSIRVWRSVSAEFAPNQRFDNWQKIDQGQRKWVDLDEQPDPDDIGSFEDWKVSLDGGHDRDARCAVRITEPYPLNILSLTPDIKVTQDI
jgi:hypothetical protein